MAKTFDVGRAKADGFTDAEIAEYIRKNKLKAINTPLNPVQGAVRMVADVLPAVGGGLGTAAGFGGGAVASAPAAGVGGIPGAVVGGTAGSLMGAAGREALYGLAGIPKDDSPLSVAGRMAGEGAYGMLGAFGQGGVQRVVQTAAPAAMQASARPLMRYALQPKRLGPRDQFIEDLALEHGVPVTQESYRFLKRLADSYVSGVGRVIAKESANPKGTRYSWNTLRAALAQARKNAAASDPISMATERALQQAQNVLKYKYEGLENMTPAQMQEIKRFAQEKAKALYKARMELKDPKVGAEESAYKLVAAEAQKLLEQIPLVAKRNRMASEAIAIQKSVMEATMRKPPTLVPGLVGAGSASLHNAFDPAAAALGAAGFFGTQAAMSPQAMSRLALLMNSPEIQALVARQAPGVGMASRTPEALGRLLGLGAPAPPPSPQEPQP